MQKINYITNLSINEVSGGWSGMNFNIFQQLQNFASINLIDSINPPYSKVDRISSKLFRTIGSKGIFPAFTVKRLNNIKTYVEPKLEKDASLNFFHGATPWLHIKNNIPYSLYLDACFGSYISVYHNQSRFSIKQLSYLFEQEAIFLENAKAVFFSSQWALIDCKKKYRISAANFFVAGLGGGLNEADILKEENTPYFLFTALDFFGKGGDKVVTAFNSISDKCPKFKLKIIGEKPPATYLTNSKVEYVGYFNKENRLDLLKLTCLFSNAYCFVLPTSKDMTPLVLVEAGSVGCPIISVNNFGISEIVMNNETGFLIDQNEELQDLLQKKMIFIAHDEVLRNKMGNAAKIHIHNNFNWKKTGEIIRNILLSD